MKAAVKQKEIAARIKELEKKQKEELLKKNGCPIKRAEKQFYDHIAKITAERTEKENELRNTTFL